MNRSGKILAGGIIGIGLVTAFSLHSSGFATLIPQVLRSVGLVEKTAISG